MLVASSLGVEVGGRFVVSGASFTVRARDKVGLVGRNGAGKTSLLGCSAVPPSRRPARVQRKGGLGYLPQDPRIDGVLDGRTAVTHVLSGRGLDEAMTRIEKLRLAMEEDPTERNVGPLRRGRGALPARRRLRRRERGARASPPASASAADRLDLPLGVLSGGERRRVELARILFAGSDVLLLDEPTNHLDADAKDVAARVPARLPRRAARHQPRPRPARRGDHPRPPPRPRRPRTASGTIVEYKGTYSQYLAARARGRGAPGQAGRRRRPRRSPACRRSSTASGPRPPKAAHGPQHEKRIARLEAERVDGPPSDRADAACASPTRRTPAGSPCSRSTG